MRKRIAALLSFLLVALPAMASAGDRSLRVAPDQARLPAPRFVPGEVVVRFDPSTSAGEKSAARASVGSKGRRSLSIKGAELLELGNGVGVSAAVAALERRASVLYAEPNYIYRKMAPVVPNDPSFGELWGLNNTGQPVNGNSGTADKDIDAPEAWEMATGSSSVLVAVVDEGVAYDHPDLAGNMWLNDDPVNGADNDSNGFIDDRHGFDFVDNDADPYDFGGHGTHVAGTIGAVGNNSAGITGVNWDVSLMAVRVLGPGGGTNEAVASGFDYAGDNGAHVVNASLGGPASSQLISDAITEHPNTLFVVAAGNGGADGVGDDNATTPTFPCNYTQLNNVCVAATDQNDALAGFSNFSSTHVDLAAPGTSVLSSQPDFASAASEGFETDFGSFTTGGTPNTWGRLAYSEGFLVTDSPSGNYPDFADTWIRTTTAVPLTEGCRLNYWAAFQLETNFDFLMIEVSTDGVNWTVLNQWSGDTGGFIYALSEDLSAFDGTNVFARFRLVSDGSITSDGVYLDNIEILCIQRGAFEGNEYTYLAGTSMATPHVAGVAALLLARDPTLTATELRATLLSNVDVVPSLSGDVATGGRLNAFSALDAIDVTPPDTTPPETTITANPASSTTSSQATFAFTSNEAGSTFLCSLDGALASACTSPLTLNNIAIGAHTFEVSAVDPSSNVDLSPDSFSWTRVKAASSTRLNSVGKTASKVTGKGSVLPAHTGILVTVKLFRKKAGVFRLLATKKVLLNASSLFTARFARPAAGSCKMTARFPGDADTKASSASKLFTC